MRIAIRSSLLPALALLWISALSQESTFTFFPGRPVFAPLRANHEEARMGLLQEIGDHRLHVQIGSAIDGAAWTWGEDTLRLGADFFAYALATTFGDYRLKIDAADGFFGLHLTYHSDARWSARFRALHYSAHLLDGRFDTDRKVWKTDRLPFPFSRNIAEFTVALRPSTVSLHRLYVGGGLSVFTKPASIRAATAHGGIELASAADPHFYFAYHGSILGIPSYIMSNTIEAGLKLGHWEGQGLRFYVAYHGGLDWYGQYYDERRSFFGGGLVLDY